MIRKIDTDNYHLRFDTETGQMARWGKTLNDDPVMCPMGPEIADVEISTVCNGIGKSMDTRVPCPWCYKSNTGKGTNMSLETFKKVFARLNAGGALTQIAFGIGDLDANPDLYQIMAYCRINNVVPNITTNGMGILGLPLMTDPRGYPPYATHADILAVTCGAVAVSHYGNDDVCFDAVQALTDRGLKQVNIHKLLSKQTYKSCFDLIDKVRTAKDSKHGPFALDKRLAGLKAIVFLLLKPKGDRNSLDSVSMDDYKKLMDYAQASGVAIGMDSCSAPMVLKTMPSFVIPSVEPCESTLFSIYVNVDGEMFPCSFTEGTAGWEKGIDLTNGDEPMWYHKRIQEWRGNLLESSEDCGDCSVKKHCRSCPVYDITICQPKPQLHNNESLVRLQRRAA